jgi:hypothetical protein
MPTPRFDDITCSGTYHRIPLEYDVDSFEQLVSDALSLEITQMKSFKLFFQNFT